MLIAMAGLPGAGKSAVATELARMLPAVHLVVDEFEDAMLRAGLRASYETGLAAYLAVEAAARTNLAAGAHVVVDAVNDHPYARGQWERLAQWMRVPLHFVEVVCSDETLHRTRLEGRSRPFQALPEPTWGSLLPRRAMLAEWRGERIVLDSALAGPSDLAKRVLALVR
ncbi:AAA family ATPase [Gryllotalpicola ginsengisoli]|uniref:AAA family ATPase n=1 Tax=Gryllotalpicola ginsengisoli TaxID=444608 RepID=UPI0003B78C6E|nr:AAA family ATPase [Gryllotalpicola ginsengisoli]